jgi:hypothetical protein
MNNGYHGVKRHSDNSWPNKACLQVQKGAKQKGSKENREPKRTKKPQHPVAPPRKPPYSDCTKLGTAIHLGGCRHGDLGALKSFTKTNAAYYTRPNHQVIRGCGITSKKSSGKLIVILPASVPYTLRQNALTILLHCPLKPFSLT